MAEPPSLPSPTRRAVLAAALSGLAHPAWAQGAPAGIPFDDSAGVITLPGTINGHPATLLIDSGAGTVVMDRAFVARIGLGPEAGTAVGHGFTGSHKGEISKPFVLGIGGATIEIPRGMIHDLSSIALTGKLPVPVIVGRDLFDRFAVEIDFSMQRLFLHQPGTVGTKGAKRAVLKPGSGGVRWVQISVEDQKPVWATFDLGSASALSIDRKYAERTGLLRGKAVSTWISAQLGGLATYDIFTAHKTSLVGQTVGAVPTDVYGNWRGDHMPSANVGYPLISRLGRIVVEYGSDALYVFPGSGEPAPFGKKRLGLALSATPDGGWRVVHVARGSPAAKAGWKDGDLVATINGKASMSAQEHGELALGAPGTTVTFGMADGLSRVVVLADYY